MALAPCKGAWPDLLELHELSSLAHYSKDDFGKGGWIC